MKKSIGVILFSLSMSSVPVLSDDGITFNLPSKKQMTAVGVGLLLDRVVNGTKQQQPQHPIGQVIRSMNQPYVGSQCIKYQTPRFDPYGRYVGQRNRYQCFN